MLTMFEFQSLLLLSYLIRNGSDRVVNNAREHLYDLRNLENFQAFDEFGKDQGINSNLNIYLFLSNKICIRSR